MAPSAPQTTEAILALDTGSPVVSVAVAEARATLAQREIAIDRSSSHLLRLVDEVLAEAGLGLRQLAGVVALRGPGSFTGLRVGLATALAFHQATAIPATALPTLEVLAAALPQRPGLPSRVVAVVDALRGEWFVQPFRTASPGRPDGPPQRRQRATLAELQPCVLTGFGVEALAEEGWPGIELVEAGPLAPVAARIAADGVVAWSPETLVQPLYLRPPAARPQVSR